MTSSFLGRASVMLAIALSSQGEDYYDTRYVVTKGSDYGEIVKARRKNQRNKAQRRRKA